MERQLRYIDQKIKILTQKKNRLVEIFASGNIEKEAYVLKNLKYDNEANTLKAERLELAARIPLLHKTEVINMSIGKHCESARVQFAKAKEFDSKRKFLLDYVSQIIFRKDEFSIHGFVPIRLNEYEGKEETEETGKIEFRIDGKVPQWELLGRKKRKPDFGVPITRQEYDRLLENNHSHVK